MIDLPDSNEYLKKSTILIVDDNKDELEEYKDLFKLYLKECFTAQNGLEGYKLYQKHRPDIIITDYKMPDMDGLTMAEKIRNIDKEIPIILHTVFTEQKVMLEAFEYKISSYVVKPANAKILLNTIIKELENFYRDAEIKKEEILMQAILEEFPEPIMVVDVEKNILFANNLLKKSIHWKDQKPIKCYEALYGYTTPCQQRGYICDSDSAIKTLKNQTNFHKNIDVLGNRTFYHIKTVPLKDEKREVYALLKVVQDKKDDISKEEVLLYKANYDALTNLPNRTLLMDRISKAIDRSNRHKKMFAILFLDLDKFKEVNDIYGHLIGDELLKKIAQRIRSILRKTDTVARFGGDEFVIILEDVLFVQNIISITEKLISQIKKEVILKDNIKVNVNCSIGIALYQPNDKKSVTTIIKNADYAMYVAKNRGEGNYTIYEEISEDD